jgi:hypothetical protein
MFNYCGQLFTHATKARQSALPLQSTVGPHLPLPLVPMYIFSHVWQASPGCDGIALEDLLQSDCAHAVSQVLAVHSQLKNAVPNVSPPDLCAVKQHWLQLLPCDTHAFAGAPSPSAPPSSFEPPPTPPELDPVGVPPPELPPEELAPELPEPPSECSPEPPLELAPLSCCCCCSFQ